MLTEHSKKLYNNFDNANINADQFKRFTKTLRNAVDATKSAGACFFTDGLTFGCCSGETDGKIVWLLGLPSVADERKVLSCLANAIALADDISICAIEEAGQIEITFTIRNIINEPLC